MRALLFTVLFSALFAGACMIMWHLSRDISGPLSDLRCLERTLRHTGECEDGVPLFGVGLQYYEESALPQ
jgi:hypothetical protein